jgi:hypothetical protein
VFESGAVFQESLQVRRKTLSLRMLGGVPCMYRVLDRGEGVRGLLLSWCPGTALIPLVNELGERRIKGQILKEVQAYESNGVESNNELFALCGDMNNPPLAVVNDPG